MIETDHLKSLLNCQEIEELWDKHTRQMKRYGFDRLIYGYTRYRTATSLGDPEDFVMMTNHDPAYTDEFIGGGLYHHAPMVRWALEHDGAVWHFANAENRALFAESPGRYAPQYGGYCAYAMAQGAKAPTVPEAWSVVDRE